MTHRRNLEILAGKLKLKMKNKLRKCEKVANLQRISLKDVVKLPRFVAKSLTPTLLLIFLFSDWHNNRHD